MSIITKAISHKLNRRSFLKWSAGVSGALAASGALQSVQQASAAGQEVIIPTSCGRSNCFDACVLKAVVKDGVMVRLEGDETLPDEPPFYQLRPCVKGRSFRKHVYSPERLKYPMKRKHWAPGGGDRTLRGKDEWVRISWDEATTIIANEMTRIKGAYGNEAFHDFGQSGRLSSALHGRRWIQRLLNRHGGYTTSTGAYSFPTLWDALDLTFGSRSGANDPWDMLNSNFMIWWSFNCYDTGWISTMHNYLFLAKEKGIPIVGVDPWYNRTYQLADKWVPILPQTDEAMMLGMLYILFKEYGAYIDQPWIEARSVGIFPRAGGGTLTDPTVPADDCMKHFVLGLDANGNPAPSGHKNYPAKTPEWAEAQCSVPAEQIRDVARRYADNSFFKGEGKKAAILVCGGMNRRMYGENAYMLLAAIATITKNIGVSGGSSGIPYQVPSAVPGNTVPAGTNPLEDLYTFDVSKRTRAFLGKPVRREMGTRKYTQWQPNIKFLWSSAGNTLNQNNDINQCLQGYRNMEFIVASDPIFTITAKHADVVLPASTAQETNEITAATYSRCYLSKCIEPLFEAKSDMEACELIAAKLGITNFNEKTEDEWLRHIWAGSSSWSPLTYEQFKAAGVARYDIAGKGRLANPEIFLKDFIANPATGKKPATPSGKIEIYSMTVKNLIDAGKVSGEVTRPIPSYPPRIEGPGDPLRKKYPLANSQSASGKRLHSTNDNSIVAWMKDIAPEDDGVIMHMADANARGIKTGDLVRVYNDRGEMHLKAFVTHRVARGATTICRGTYYNPKEPGVIGSPSIGGGPSVLTLVDVPVNSLLQGTPSGSCLVEIKKL